MISTDLTESHELFAPTDRQLFTNSLHLSYPLMAVSKFHFIYSKFSNEYTYTYSECALDVCLLRAHHQNLDDATPVIMYSPKHTAHNSDKHSTTWTIQTRHTVQHQMVNCLSFRTEWKWLLELENKNETVDRMPQNRREKITNWKYVEFVHSEFRNEHMQWLISSMGYTFATSVFIVFI